MDGNGGQLGPQAEVLRGDEMRTPDEVAAMLRLKALGWGIKRIARELGCSHMTVRRYVAAGRYVPYRRPVGRPRALAGLEGWLAERFRRHAVKRVQQVGDFARPQSRPESRSYRSTGRRRSSGSGRGGCR